MFGAVGSVHAWERIGAALTHIARHFLNLALYRYVDDYFGPDRRESSCVLIVAHERVMSGAKRWRMVRDVLRPVLRFSYLGSAP